MFVVILQKGRHVGRLGIGILTQTLKQTNKKCIEKQEGTKYIDLSDSCFRAGDSQACDVTKINFTLSKPCPCKHFYRFFFYGPFPQVSF